MKKTLDIRVSIDSREEVLSLIKQRTVSWSYKNAYDYCSLQFKMGRKYLFFFLLPDTSVFKFSISEYIGYCAITGEIRLLKQHKILYIFALIFLDLMLMDLFWGSNNAFIPVIAIGFSIFCIWYVETKYYDKRLERKILALFEPIMIKNECNAKI